MKQSLIDTQAISMFSEATPTQLRGQPDPSL